MADNEKKENEEGTDGAEGEEAPSGGKKKGLILGGGILALVATAYALSVAAVPKEEGRLPFEGPYVIDLSPDTVQVNLTGEAGKRFLVMKLKAEYEAYDEAYATARVVDTLYQAKLQDALIRIARQKSKDDLDDAAGEEIFMGEVREGVDPLLFPIHVGNETSHTAGHEDSGIAPGNAIHRSTLRGGFFDHVITVDAPARTMSLDGGPATEFVGDEDNLTLINEYGQTLYVDVTGLSPEFKGEVHAGTFGRVRSVLLDNFLIQ